MHYKSLISGLFLVFLLSSFGVSDDEIFSPVYQLPKNITAADYLPNTLIIKFKDVTLGRKPLSTGARLLQTSDKIRLSYIKPIYNSETKTKETLANQQLVHEVGLNRIYEIGYQSSLNIEAVINELLKDPSVEYAEPRFVYHTMAPPNDVSFSNGTQFYIDQVKAPDAWNVQPNANGVVIAIVDSGSDLQHVDLAANIYRNEKDPINGIDDDGDGYIDNYMGWDFVGANADNIIEDNDPDVPADSLDHGVHVSGLASAVTNNGIGIASIAQTAKLMILKAGADNSASAIYKGYEGIIYAADRGVKIINCSWGGPGGGAYGQDVINYAVSRGCLVVVAAGNRGTSELFYPAAYKGAFAVANVLATDAKAKASSFGYHVAISAPGTGIYSTVNNDNYGYKSGTSMAAPIVSSAAALVAAKNPTLSGLQIGELLRLTADDIYSGIPENQLYLNQLGSGRLNVFKAVTSTGGPSIRYQNIEIKDSSNGSLSAGDTIEYFFDLKNLLFSCPNLEVRLKTDNPNVQVLTGTVAAGAFAAMEIKKVGPFKVLVSSNTPENTTVLFELSYANPLNGYQAKEFFNGTVNLDYQNITVNQLYTTITSNGRIGYSAANAHNGLGVLYKDYSLLYEGALMIGVSTTQVSNNARSKNGGSDEDFIKLKGVARIRDTDAAYEGWAVFTDSLSSNPIGISVINKQMAYKNKPDDKYVIVTYEITNDNNQGLDNLYVGLFTDWDVDESSKNILTYDSDTKMAYVYATTPLSPYAGLKLLSDNAKPLFYPLSYQLGTDFLYDGNFSIEEKYTTLSSGVKEEVFGVGDGLDVMCVIGNGPYHIPAHKSIKVAFALIVGDDLEGIKKSAEAARLKFTTSEPKIGTEFTVSQNYPNPAIVKTSIKFNLPKDGFTSLVIYDYMGRKIADVFSEELSKGEHVQELDTRKLGPGLYFYKLAFAGKEITKKMIVLD